MLLLIATPELRAGPLLCCLICQKNAATRSTTQNIATPPMA
jgi:hypothetical protein